MPGVSTKAICADAFSCSPSTRCRVVWGLGVTMLSFWPISAFSKVDLPTFGRPTSAAKPQRKSSLMNFTQYCRGSLLLGAPPAQALPDGAQGQRAHFTAHPEGLRMNLPFGAHHLVGRQR